MSVSLCVKRPLYQPCPVIFLLFLMNPSPQIRARPGHAPRNHALQASLGQKKTPCPMSRCKPNAEPSLASCLSYAEAKPVLAKYFAKIAKFSVINEALKSGIPTKLEHESSASSGPWERGRLPQRKKEKEGITQRRLPGISPKPPSGYRNEQESLATTPLDGSMTNWPGPYCPVAYKYSMRFNI